jgi:hypothetical protein
MQICPYCKDYVLDDVIECSACGAGHHPDCWAANDEVCSVFGCDSRSAEGVAGCPWCDEIYGVARNACLICNSPLLTPAAYFEFLESHVWTLLPLNLDTNATLAVGYLRNNGVVARIQKGTPISMFGLQGSPRLWVSADDEEYAGRLLQELRDNYTHCIICGHVVTREESDCSFCAESMGADA